MSHILFLKMFVCWFYTQICAYAWLVNEIYCFKFQAVQQAVVAVPFHILCMEESSLEVLQIFSIPVSGKQYNTDLKQQNIL